MPYTTPQFPDSSQWPMSTPIDQIHVNVGTQAAVGANTTVTRTFTVNGLKPGTHYVVNATKPTDQAGLFIGNCRVSANNTLSVQYCNCTAAGITPTANEVYAFGIVMAPLQTKNTQYGSGIVS